MLSTFQLAASSPAPLPNLRGLPPDILPDSIRERIAVRAGAAWNARYKFLPWLDDQQAETQDMVDRYMEMLKDDTVRAALLSKVYDVSSQDWQSQPASESPRDEMIANFALYNFQQCEGDFGGGTPSVVEELVLPALIKKVSIAEIVYREDPVQRGKWMGKRVWKQLKAREQARLVEDAFGNVIAVTGPGVSGGQEEFPLEENGKRRFLILKNLSIFSRPISEMRAVWRWFVAKDTLIKLWLIGLEKYGNPYLLAKYSSDADRTALDEALSQLRSNTYALVPQGVELEWSSAVASAANFEAAIDRCDKGINTAIKGAFLDSMTSGESGGERGNSTVHKNTSEKFSWRLSEAVKSVINTQAIPSLIDENFARADYPTISIGAVNLAELLKQAELDQKLLAMKLPLSAKAKMKYYGQQQAHDDADDLSKRGQPPAGGLGGMFGGGGGGGSPQPPPTPNKNGFRAINTRRGGRAAISSSGRKIYGKDAERALSQFADDGESHATGAAHEDTAAAENLLEKARLDAVATLQEIVGSAVERNLHDVDGLQQADELFDDAEREQLQDLLRDVMGPAELLGRARILLRGNQAEQFHATRRSGVHHVSAGDLVRRFSACLDKPAVHRFADVATDLHCFNDLGDQGRYIEPMAPQDAIDFFEELVPELGISPERFGEYLERHSFTMAAATEETILRRVQEAIANRLNEGKGISTLPGEIEDILDEVGVTPRNPNYCEMVVRTNMMDSYNTGAQRQLSKSKNMFPVWEYSNPDDGRSRPEHAERAGRYFSSDVPFAAVRGTDIGEVANCRCVLPGAFVDGSMIAASKSFYSGEVVEIVTRRGARLSITPNHPVLSEHGFIPAGQVLKGQNLVNYVGHQKPLAEMDDKKNRPSLIEDVFGSFLQHNALRVTKRQSALDFHGDGYAIKGDIEIVVPNRELRGHFDADSLKRRNDRDLLLCLVEQLGVASRRPAQVGMVLARGGADSAKCNARTDKAEGNHVPRHAKSFGNKVDGFSVGVSANDCSSVNADHSPIGPDFHASGHELFSQSLILEADFGSQRRESFSGNIPGDVRAQVDCFGVKNPSDLARSSERHDLRKLLSDGHGVDAELSCKGSERRACLVTDRNIGDVRNPDLHGEFASLRLRPDPNATSREPFLDGGSANADLILKPTNRLASEVTLDEVVEVRRFFYSGHVYDLQTVDGWYSASTSLSASIVIHNCTFVPVSKFEWEDLQADGAEVEPWGDVRRFSSLWSDYKRDFHEFAWTAFETRKGTTGAKDDNGKKVYGARAQAVLNPKGRAKAEPAASRETKPKAPPRKRPAKVEFDPAISEAITGQKVAPEKPKEKPAGESQAEAQQRFARTGLPKIKAYEERSGRPWMDLVLRQAGQQSGYGTQELWHRIIQGDSYDAVADILADENFRQDYGNVSQAEFDGLVKLLKNQGYIPAAQYRGTRGSEGERPKGMISDLNEAKMKAEGLLPGDKPTRMPSAARVRKKKDTLELGEVGGDKPSVYEAYGIKSPEQERAERKRFEQVELPKIKAIEERTGRPWLDLVLRQAGQESGQSVDELWDLLSSGQESEAVSAIIANEDFANDYGSMSAGDLAKMVGVLKESGYIPAAKYRGTRGGTIQDRPKGMISDLPAAKLKRAGLTTGKRKFSDFLFSALRWWRGG